MRIDQVTKPLITIVVPVYNAEEYLLECLDSVFSQTYSNIEVICVDDGSTDRSLEIVKKYAEKHANMVVITQKNSGIIKTRNNAIKEAAGQYILPLDSDDIITSDCVEKLYNLITETHCGVAAPSVEFCGDKRGAFILPDPTPENMAQGNCIVSCGMFEKVYWEKYGGYDKRFSNGLEDYDFWWNFIQDGKKIVRTSDVLFFYRIKDKSESRNIQTGHHHADILKAMPEKYPLMRKLQRRHLRRIKVERLKLRVKRAKVVPEWRRYKNYVINQQIDKADYVPIAKNSYSGKKPKKLIAYYLPQYYQISQNDLWFGRGFTEWTNCTKAVPQYTGHWQPHLPIDVGFYDLETTRVMHRQVELAKMYGIHGFCYYYYWFSGGDKIMEKPLNNLLKDNSLDFPFMIFWANEDWTNNWGEEADLGTKTYSAKMKPGDAEMFVDDIIPFFKDKRYIKVGDRPHLIIYQAMKDPYLPNFIKEIKQLIEERGIKAPYVSLVFPDESPMNFSPRELGADAAVEFGVHMKMRPDHVQEPLNKTLVNPIGRMTAYDMKEFVEGKKFDYQTDFPIYKGAMTTFDNTARKIYTGAHMFSLSPELYRKWLSEIIKTSKTEYIFISAWNEWAEGMHLEPDQRFGYAYLQATRDALEGNT